MPHPLSCLVPHHPQPSLQVSLTVTLFHTLRSTRISLPAISSSNLTFLLTKVWSFYMSGTAKSLIPFISTTPPDSKVVMPIFTSIFSLAHWQSLDYLHVLSLTHYCTVTNWSCVRTYLPSHIWMLLFETEASTKLDILGLPFQAHPVELLLSFILIIWSNWLIYPH